MARAVMRGFVDVAEGQIHYRTCGDGDLPALVMFHGSPGSSYSLLPLMRALARRRRVIAIDTMGNGDSCPTVMSEPSIAELADGHMRAIDALEVDRFDLYGYHTGTCFCTEIALAWPRRVRRMVLEGVSVFSASDRTDLLDNDHAPDIPEDLSGTHLMAAFTMVRDAHLFWPWWDRRAEARRPLGLPTAAYLHGEVIEVLKASRTYFRSYRAALRYPKRERLPLIGVPTLVAARPSDQLFAFLEEATSLIPGAISTVLPEVPVDADRSVEAQVMLRFLEAD